MQKVPARWLCYGSGGHCIALCWGLDVAESISGSMPGSHIPYLATTNGWFLFAVEVCVFSLTVTKLM